MEKISEKEFSSNYKNFLTEVETKGKVDEKIRLALDFMKRALSNEQPPSFREFWNAKRQCLEFFKEKLTSHAREIFWQEYVFLSGEARQIKTILDEQSSFAYEQLVLALDSVEQDLEDFDTKLLELPPLEVPEGLPVNTLSYSQLQKELDLLNACAERIGALRKELVHVSVRIKLKNRLFERLKVLGDRVFPSRKEKMRVISALFQQDVEAFLSSIPLEPGLYLKEKEKIKALQKFAKAISLAPSTFSKTRELLSGYWDKIKQLETEFRKERAEEKAQVQSEVGKIAPEVEALAQECKDEKICLREADKKIEELLARMNDLKLPKELEKRWKKQIIEAKQPLEEKEKALRQKEKETQEKEWLTQQEHQARLLKNLADLINQAETLSLDLLVEKWELALKEEKTLKTKGAERSLVVHRLDTICDSIQEKKWQTLLDDGGENLVPSIRSLLNERHKEKQKIKARLEEYRKLIGGSNLNLEQSLLYQGMVSDDKLRLDAIEILLEELEEKLFDLED